MPLNENLFLRGFLADLYLRPSCYACPLKCGKSGSDMTLGDFWGIQRVIPKFDDDKGCSAVLCYSLITKSMLLNLNLEMRVTSLNCVIVGNQALVKSPNMPRDRNEFYSMSLPLDLRIIHLCRMTFKRRMSFFIKRIFRRLLRVLRV